MLPAAAATTRHPRAYGTWSRALRRVQPCVQQQRPWRRQAATASGRRNSGDGDWNELEDGLRYRLSEDPMVGTETVEVEHSNGGRSPSAVVILTHGLGDSARGWAQAALQLCSELPWTRWVLPSAPNKPVTLNGGISMPAWYDIVGLSDRAAEHCDGIQQSHETLLRLVNKELESLQLHDPEDGSRLVLAGFSQGGAMSLHTALRWPGVLPLPAGVLCMSGYLPLPDTHEAQLPGVSGGRILQTPMLLCHGDADPMVRPEWSTATVDRYGARVARRHHSRPLSVALRLATTGWRNSAARKSTISGFPTLGTASTTRSCRRWRAGCAKCCLRPSAGFFHRASVLLELGQSVSLQTPNPRDFHERLAPACKS